MSQKLLNKIFFCLFLVLAACNQESQTGLGPGDNAPAIELSGLDNKNYKLSDYKGKVVLLNFWATWCGPCVEEMPALQELYNKLDKNNFAIVAVGVDDTVSSLSEFQKQYSLTFPVLADKSGSVKAKYKISGVPESFILDKSGKLVMFPDLNDNMPVVRIVGPRNWSSPEAIERIKEIAK